ncbi:hypothetical protein KR093_004803 [Drosophila rubida]|uniref:LIM zinc-binding domain-containing protein n=1 Tax=Drosophila rubida TaxID=30044 RepID=A0AAD4K5G5_9MUSC|nr:hypothetical protein KR093_004803 [Drosophila rubida]
MYTLEEQLRELGIGNSKCEEECVSTGKVSALVDNLQQKGSSEQSSMHKKMISKTAPCIPPKPCRRSLEMPQVPLSKQVTDTQEPLYSQPLQSLELVANKETEKVSLLLRKQPIYGIQNEQKMGSNQSTLDNPAVLEQQLEALAYHKLQMEKRGLLRLQAATKCKPVTNIPNLSSTSLSTLNVISQNAYCGLKQTTPDNILKSTKTHSEYNSDLDHSTIKKLPGEISICMASLPKKDVDDELLPPPSPVSSSYSELRRANDVCKATVDLHKSTGIQLPVTAYENYGNQCARNITSKTSSTYDSIYEPINPRLSNDVRASFSMYANIKQSNSLPASRICGDKSLSTNCENIVAIATERQSLRRCFKCGDRVLCESSSCMAMDQFYHISCFICTECQINLQGKPFYALEGNPFCEYDYLQTLEKCSVCLKPILERILRATGKPYHPQCFTCVVCGNSLDAVPFTVDAINQNYCIADFHKKFAPRCCVCKEPILPASGQEETVRVVALDRSFHLECYKCEDCGLLLSSEADGRGCYPLDDHVLCKSCNARRVQVLTNHMT